MDKGLTNRVLLGLLLLGCVVAVTLVVVYGQRGAQPRQENAVQAPGAQPAQGLAGSTEPESLPATAQVAIEHKAALSPNQKAEPGAEFWSLPPLLQQNAATNFVRAMERLTNATSDFECYLALDSAAKLAFSFGKIEDARGYARELLALDKKFAGEPWRSGDAVHDGNLVLGRIALHEGKLEEAKRYLLEAGRSTGSPVLGSFGPNLSLARDLLQKGQKETVIQYFELCKKFWSTGRPRLTEWMEQIRAGKTPDFEANLYH